MVGWVRTLRLALRARGFAKNIQREVRVAEQEGKSPLASKTLWVNVIALAAILVQKATGTDYLDAETQAGLLAVVNLVLRLVTKEPLRTSGPSIRAWILVPFALAAAPAMSHAQVPFEASVTWLHRDVSTWPITSTVTAVVIEPDRVCVEHTRAGTWPTSRLETIDVEGNIWIFAQVQGQWYGATWDWLRVGQTCKAVTAAELGRDQIRRAPLDASWQPTPGEWIGFMTSTRARDGVSAGEERSNIVFVAWPGAPPSPPGPGPGTGDLEALRAAVADVAARLDALAAPIAQAGQDSRTAAERTGAVEQAVESARVEIAEVRASLEEHRAETRKVLTWAKDWRNWVAVVGGIVAGLAAK